MGDEQGYLAYLVRLWTVRRDGDMVWHASATNAHTGEQHVFSEIATLCAFFGAAVERNVPAPATLARDHGDESRAPPK